MNAVPAPLSMAPAAPRLLLACLVVSLLLHAAAVGLLPGFKPREPEPLTFTARLRAAEVPLEPAPAPAQPEPPSAQPEPPKPPPEPVRQAVPEPAPARPAPVEPRPAPVAPAPRPQPAPEARAPEPTPAAPPAAPAPAPAAAATPSPAAPAPAAEARGERDAPKSASTTPSPFQPSENDSVLVDQFEQVLKRVIERRGLRFYPQVARENGWEGTAWVMLRVGPDGGTRAIEIARTSGHEILDKSARSAVEKARGEALMQTPPGLKGKPFDARVAIVFELPK